MPVEQHQNDARSAAARSYRHLYKTARWKRESRAFLRDHPLCVMCPDKSKRGATIVDHVTPHRGDPDLFWNQDNWQALCRSHHSRSAQQQDIRGFHSDVGEDGSPTDPNHPFNR